MYAMNVPKKVNSVMTGLLWPAHASSPKARTIPGVRWGRFELVWDRGRFVEELG